MPARPPPDSGRDKLSWKCHKHHYLARSSLCLTTQHDLVSPLTFPGSSPLSPHLSLTRPTPTVHCHQP